MEWQYWNMCNKVLPAVDFKSPREECSSVGAPSMRVKFDPRLARSEIKRLTGEVIYIIYNITSVVQPYKQF